MNRKTRAKNTIGNMIGKYGPEKCDLKNTVQKNTIRKMQLKNTGKTQGQKPAADREDLLSLQPVCRKKYYNSTGNNAGKRRLLPCQLFEFLHAGGVVGGGIFVVFQFCPVNEALHQLEIL